MNNLYPSFQSSIQQVWNQLHHITIRPLYNEEIEQLQKNQNQSNHFDWDNVFLIQPSQEMNCVSDLSTISNCTFLDKCYIAAQHGSVTFQDEISLPAGCSNSTFRNCFIFSGVAVALNTLIENTVICSGSIVMGCGRISCNQQSSYGNGTIINMGNETDGFKVAITADMVYNDLSPTRLIQSNLSSYLYQSVFLVTSQSIQGDYSVFHGCFVESCPLLHSVYIGPSAHLLSSSIQHSTVLSSESIPTLVQEGVITNSILQWGVCFETHSNCCLSLLCEHAETSCNAKIVNSIIAPNTGVSSGECNSSLVGPFIGFHHNSVLISALWFEGKGNIGYGANIGSNHTGRLPDQECIPGEGVFFGLGCSIKYPCNLHNAPYSIIASGVTLLPQRMEMPFSLINKPTLWREGCSPAFAISFTPWR